VAAFLVALSPLLIFQSAEARMYPLLILLVALQANEYLKLMEDPKRSAWRWATLSGLALFTHLTAATPFLIMAGHRLWTLRKDRRQLVHAGLMMLLAATPFLCWLVIAATGRGGSVGSEWQVNPDQGSLVPLSWHFTSFFVNDAANWQRAFVFVALSSSPSGALRSEARWAGTRLARHAEPDRRAWLLAALTVMPFLASSASRPPSPSISWSPPRPPPCSSPEVWPMPARRAEDQTPDSHSRRRHFHRRRRAGRRRSRHEPAHPLRRVARFIETREQPGDVVYASWFPTLLPLERQYHASRRSTPSTPSRRRCRSTRR